jgi:hypothetical protein
MYHAHVRFIELTEDDYETMVQERGQASSTEGDQ